jgi:signal transduction histidine kinase
MTSSARLLWGRVPRADVAIALGVAVAEVGGTLVVASQPGFRPVPTLLGIGLLLLTSVPLLVRNVYPVEVLAVVTAATIAYMLLGQPGPFFWFAMVFVLWAAVSAGHRIAGIVASGALLVAFLVAAFVLDVGHSAEPDAPIWLAGWIVASIVLGEVSRSRREYIEQVEQRAIDAERSRDEEARRRAGEERLRIARELHDVLAHNISLINVQSGVALHLLDKQPDQAKTALVAINDASKEALRELRATLGVLRGADEAEPLAPAPGLARLDDLVEGARAAGLDVDVAVTGDSRPLPAATDLTAYRIVQESLTNVARHAGPAHVAISIEHRPGDVVVTVDDDGSGVDGTQALEEGNGLTGMRERAVASGGDLEAGPRPGGGFTVRARLPIEDLS